MTELRRYVPVLLREVVPLQGELGVYLVESRSRPTIQHRVDVLAYNGNGACGCEHFEIKFRGKLERGAKPARELACRHLKLCREVWGIEMAMAYARVKQAERKCELETKTKTESLMANGAFQREKYGTHQSKAEANKIYPDE